MDGEHSANDPWLSLIEWIAGFYAAFTGMLFAGPPIVGFDGIS